MTTPTNDQLQSQINDINAKLAAAQIPGFGPAPANPDGTPMNLTPNGSQVPWNGQAGEGGECVFQGHAEWLLTVPAGFNGTRGISVSGRAPVAVKAFELKFLDANGNLVGEPYMMQTGFLQASSPPLVGGQTYKVVIDATNPTTGCGAFQLVGGA